MRTRSLATAAGATALIALIAAPSALAADYPVLRGSQPAEDTRVASDLFSGSPKWDGFYAGGAASYTAGRFDSSKQAGLMAQDAFYRMKVGKEGSDLLRFGRESDQRPGFSAFAGMNFQFGEAVLGGEIEYIKMGLAAGQTNSISRVFSDIVDTTMTASTSSEPKNTETLIDVSGQTKAEISDIVLLKARGGYAMGSFMPFINAGVAVGRMRTSGSLTQTHRTYEHWDQYAVMIDPADGTEKRGAYLGPRTFYRPDASGTGEGRAIQSGFVPGLALGAGIDAQLADNILLRAEFNRIYFTNFKGVDTVVNSARIGAGVKF